MAFYSSSEQFYGCAQALFERLLTGNPEVAEPVEKARLLMLFRCSEPTVTFLINGRRRPASAEFGSIKMRPEIQADLSNPTWGSDSSKGHFDEFTQGSRFYMEANGSCGSVP